MKKLLLFALLSLSFNSQAESLKILTWNIFLLPKPIKFSYQAERTKLISELLNNSDYDIIFLQEAFPGSFHDHLFGVTKKKYPHQYYLKRPFISHTVFGSGVYVMSRFPIKSKKKAIYDSCRGADCFAAKGVLLATFELPGGKEIQIGNTHLQAGRDAKGSKIRLKQIEQIRKLFNESAKPGVTQILLGDINIDAKHEDFLKALSLLNMESSALSGDLDHTNGFPISCYNKPGDNVKEWIDHILVSKNSDIKLTNKKVIVYKAVLEGRECPLSDHYALEATLNL